MTTKPFEFETALKELEEITVWFESSKVDLDAGLVKFERGMELAAQLKTHLTDVENRVEKIKARFSATPPAADTHESASPAPTHATTHGPAPTASPNAPSNLPAPAPSNRSPDDRPPLEDRADLDQTDLFGT